MNVTNEKYNLLKKARNDFLRRQNEEKEGYLILEDENIFHISDPKEWRAKIFSSENLYEFQFCAVDLSKKKKL